MDSTRLFDTVVEVTKSATQAIEGTKAAMQQNAESMGRIAQTLEKVAETNAKQTEAVNKVVAREDAWELEKKEMRELHEKQIKKLERLIWGMAVLLFIGVGGYTLLKQLVSLGFVL